MYLYQTSSCKNCKKTAGGVSSHLSHLLKCNNPQAPNMSSLGNTQDFIVVLQRGPHHLYSVTSQKVRIAYNIWLKIHSWGSFQKEKVSFSDNSGSILISQMYQTCLVHITNPKCRQLQDTRVHGSNYLTKYCSPFSLPLFAFSSSCWAEVRSALLAAVFGSNQAGPVEAIRFPLNSCDSQCQSKNRCMAVTWYRYSGTWGEDS